MPPRKLVVVESEKSQGVVHANWKQKEFLMKNVQMLKKAERMVTNRITLNQRLTYKKFKQKLYQAKLNHARLVGDKEAERELRGNTDRFSFNTNFGLNPEDEEVLQKIWSRSTPTPSNVRPQTSPNKLRQPETPRPPTRAKSVMSVARPAAKRRTATALPDISRDQRKAQYIATGGGKQPGDGASDAGSEFSVNEDDDDDDDDDEVSPCQMRPKTAHFAGNLPTKKYPGGRPTPRAVATAPEQPTTSAPTIFEEDTRPSLLDVHRQRIESANYEGRVKKLCGRMKPFMISSDYLIPDYYTIRLDAEVKAGNGGKHHVKQMPGTPSGDIKRAMGNIEVKSLTLKRINYDRETPTDLIQNLECLTI